MPTTYQRPAGFPEREPFAYEPPAVALDGDDWQPQLGRHRAMLPTETFLPELAQQEPRLTLGVVPFARDVDPDPVGDPERLDRVPFGVAVDGLAAQHFADVDIDAAYQPFDYLQPEDVR